MPKTSSSNQPNIPKVSADLWKSLVTASNEFSQLAPWEWMHDSQVIGLRYPDTKEVLLGSILGRLREVFALFLYRNEAGHRWILDMILSDGDLDPLELADTAFDQDVVKVEFVPKRELSKEDKSTLEAAGAMSAKQRGGTWPQFRNLVPGGFPWYLQQSEAEMLLFALPRVSAVARLVRADPQIWHKHRHGEIAFIPENFNPATDVLRADQFDWQPMIPPPRPSPGKVCFDAATLERLRKLPQARGFHLELDAAYAPFPVADADRPRFPKLALAVDFASGVVGGFHIGNSGDAEVRESLGKAMADAMNQFGHRPETIRVQRSRIQTMLAEIGKELGIPVKLEARLEALNLARASVEQGFR